MICTGCSCLCDDVVVDEKVRHACRIGASLILNRNVARAEPMVDGRKTDLDSAIESAIELLKDSNKVLIYGLNYSTLEAQRIAMKLAKKIDAYLDNGLRYDLAEKLLDGEVRIATLEDVRDYAYVMMFWMFDAHNEMPRLMSRTYYARGKKRQRGYEEDRFLVVVDVRRSHTAMLAKKNAIFIEYDDELIKEFETAIRGGLARREVLKVVGELKKSDFNVIFTREFLPFANEFGYIVPTIPQTNAMGFYKVLREEGGKIGRLEELDIDTILVVGDDPLNDLPLNAIPNFIVIDPKVSFTSKIARVVIPSAISGLECGGTMLRCDLVEMKLKPPFKSEIDDVEILKRILRGL